MDELVSFLTQADDVRNPYDLWDQYKFTRRTDFDISEVHQRQNGGRELDIVHRLIRQSEVRTWLSSGPRPEDTNTNGPKILRIVWIKHNGNEQTDDISADTLTQLLNAFDLKQALRYTRTSFAGVTALPSTTKSDGSSSLKKSFAISIHPKLNLTWSYDSTTRTTSAICFGTQVLIDHMKATLNAKWSFSAHPLFLAFICSIVLANEIDRDQNSIKRDVRETEVRTGFHRWTGRPERPAPGDLSILSAQMSGCSTKMASVERKAAVVQEIHRMILEQSDQYDPPNQKAASTSVPTSSLPSGPSNIDQAVTNTPTINESSSHQPQPISQSSLLDSNPHPLTTATNHLTTRLHLSNTDTTFIRARITTQLTALAYLITQNDTIASQSVAQDSRTLAIASHRDSSSMKTLAVVTMFFLPGTFVASLFAMPFFGVDDDKVVLNRDFGVYWAVTVPLTVATMGLWVFWTVWRGWRDERVDRDERTKVRKELAGWKGLKSVGTFGSEKSGRRGRDWTVDVDGDGDEADTLPEIGTLVRKRTALERQKTK